MEFEMSWDDVPPSVNAVGVGRSKAHWAYTRAKGTWQGICLGMLLKAKVPKKAGRYTVTATMRFPNRRRRDEGNFRALLEKCMGDALQVGGWIKDDTPDQYSFGSLAFCQETGPKRTTVRIVIE